MAPENTAIVGGAGLTGDDLFDPKSFVTSSALNGKRGVVVEAEFIQHNYNGKTVDLSTALRIVIYSDELERKFRENLVPCGNLFPSETPMGAKAIRGNYVTGGRPEKSTVLAAFMVGRKASGHPGLPNGAASLIGSDFTWKSFEKKVNNEPKGYDIPAQYHGQVDVAPLLERYKLWVAAKTGASADLGAGGITPPAIAGIPSSAPTDTTELREELGKAVIAAVQRNGGELARGQLSAQVGPMLTKDRAQALVLLLKDEFLSSIPGLTYDKKTVRLTAASPEPVTPSA